MPLRRADGNLNVTLLQAASLPTAAAELGWNAVGQSAIQFVKNASGKERKAVEQRAYRFGDTLLPTRMRGSRRGELSTAAKDQAFSAHCTMQPGTAATKPCAA